MKTNKRLERLARFNAAIVAWNVLDAHVEQQDANDVPLTDEFMEEHERAYRLMMVIALEVQDYDPTYWHDELFDILEQFNARPWRF